MLFTAAFWLAVQLPHVLDIALSDDASHSLIGHLWPNIDFYANWAPLYSLWHALLDTISGGDRILSYDLNNIVLVILFTPAFYLGLTKLGFPLITSFTLTLWFLTANVVLSSSPRITLFAGFIIYGSLTITKKKKQSFGLS